MSADGARKLFVGGLADSVSEDALRAVFEGAGFNVEHLALPRDRESGRLRGFAFITLDSDEAAARARQQLQGADCAGRPLSIREFSQEAPKRGPPGERPPRQEEPTVFLGKLPFEASAQEIEELFNSQGAGPVTRLTLPLGPDGRPRGFGFATLASLDQVDIAVAKVNGSTLRGRQIVVSPAQPRGAGGPGGPSGPPGGGMPGRDPSRRPPPRYGDRPSMGGGPSFDPYEGSIGEPPAFPPGEGRGGAAAGGRRREVKKEKKEKRRGGGAGSSEAPPRGEKKQRGGGGNWHRWESDDD